jgi:hypothetical protein
MRQRIKTPAPSDRISRGVSEEKDGSQELEHKLARARENGIEALLDEAAEVAAEPMMGEEVTIEKADEDNDSEEVVRIKRSDMVAHRRLKIETYIKLAQMMKPKKYGAKLDLTSNGETILASKALEQARLAASRRQGSDQQQ